MYYFGICVLNCYSDEDFGLPWTALGPGAGPYAMIGATSIFFESFCRVLRKPRPFGRPSAELQMPFV